MQVNLISDIIAEHSIPINIPISKLPDHSLLECEVGYLAATIPGKKNDPGIKWEGSRLKRYRMNKLKEDFFSSDRIKAVTVETITRITNARKSAEEITQIYSNLTDTIHKQLDENMGLNNIDKTTVKNKKPKYNKPFWSE